jgi:hypothetical protein
MAIKPLTKNSIGVVLALLLVIVLSESKLFNVFTETYLGRAFLIVVILFASYLNKILGVICVFIIIIMFSCNKNETFFEGIDGTVTTANPSIGAQKNTPTTTSTTSTTSTTNNDMSTALNTPTTVPNDKINVMTSSPATTATTTKNKAPTSTTSTSTTNASSPTTTSSPASSSTSSIEGFDLQSTENTILRGKQSNTIPLNQYNNQSIEVAPYEGSSFSNFFGLFK